MKPQKNIGLISVFSGLLLFLFFVLLSDPLSFQVSIDAAATSLVRDLIAERQIESKNRNLTTMERNQVCDFSSRRTDVCEINGDVRIHGNSSTIQFITANSLSEEDHSWRIKPHPRKGDKIGIEVQFLIVDMKQWWFSKYRLILNQLTNYKIIDLDKENRVLCYPKATIGLEFHVEMSIDPSRTPKNRCSMEDFARMLRSSYSLEREMAIRLEENIVKKPRLMIIARKWSRSFTNIGEIVRMAEGLGFEAVVAECDVKSNLTEFAKTMNSFDVLMGVHGAGLTNLVFLPSNAIVIQVVPLGGLGGLSWEDFGRPSIDMKLRYLQYEISEDESTLIEEYPKDHPVFKDPSSIKKQGWLSLREIYLIKQNVKLDVKRFKGVLLKALELLHDH
ncbi:hypothetical protein J5N97_027891 [Dioscorea zingiberensis]|uniref:Glycosyltransferase 61 catalytic domain-containing protein n=1 Tax=Dioscorea zingiberensis TaxID=325984 RepID=A0A9D5BY34_9LILI|nr:hypothetical protein J5N97_027891 [Dioscorea zingiberensis]